MEEKLKYTSREQFKVLVDILSDNPEAGRDYDIGEKRPDTREIWEYIKLKMNELGPPVKDEKGWKRVWHDYKAKVKKLIEKNKTLDKNKQIPLSPMQRKISKILYGHLNNDEIDLENESWLNSADSNDEYENSKNNQTEEYKSSSENDDEKLISLKPKISSREQLYEMVSMLEKHPEIARGLVKKRNACSFWIEVEKKLNKMGISRSSDKWARAWRDMRNKLRNKLLKNNIKDIASVDGANLFLSPLEERILKFIDLSEHNHQINTPKSPNRQSKRITEAKQDTKKIHAIKSEEMETENFVDEEYAENLLDENDDNFECFSDYMDSFENQTDVKDSKFRHTLNRANLFLTEKGKINNNGEMNDVKRLLDTISKDIKVSNEMKRKHYDEILKIEREKFKMYEKEMEEKSSVNKLKRLKLSLEIKDMRQGSKRND